MDNIPRHSGRLDKRFVNDLVHFDDDYFDSTNSNNMQNTESPEDVSSIDAHYVASNVHTPMTSMKENVTNHLFRGRPGGGSTRVMNNRVSSDSDDQESVCASDPGGIVVSQQEFSQLNNRMRNIKHKLDERKDNDEKYIKLKQENAVLKEKFNSLEEQLMLTEDKWKTQFDEQERRSRDLLSRAERERSLEVDSVMLRYQLLERDHEKCLLERGKIADDIDKMKQRCETLEQTVAQLKKELEMNKDSKRETEMKLWKTKENMEKRLRKTLEECEELRKEIEILRNEKGRIDSTANEKENELERLRQEQKRLRQLNNELNSELLQVSVEHGRHLLSSNTPSLADEMERMSKDQIMEALRDQEIVNQKLKVYVDGILLRILEMYPAILEIQPNEKASDSV